MRATRWMATAGVAALMAGLSSCGGSPSMSAEDIPAVIQNFGFRLAEFDPATGMAGDMRITGVVPPVLPDSDPNKAVIDAANRHLVSHYGAGEQNGSRDVQMSIFLPLGTEVTSMVDGTVCDVPVLYSGDYSVRVAPAGMKCRDGGASVLFETEHVLAPRVKVGDAVTAGQVVATVSDYRSDWRAIGMGIVEIGVFFSKDNSGVPWHACPLKYLAPDKAESLRAALASVMAAWEAELGDPSLYDETLPNPTCVVEDAITESNNGAVSS